MADVVVFHNPRCGNSRTALQMLGARGDQVEVIEYLKAPLDRATLDGLLDILIDPPADLIRHDQRFAELGLDADGYGDRTAVVELLLEYPELMQRPVLVSGGRAIIARPPAQTVPAFLG
jgi:arsenate reductase